MPPPELCTDNAGDDRLRRALVAAGCRFPDYLALDAYATGEPPP